MPNRTRSDELNRSVLTTAVLAAEWNVSQRTVLRYIDQGRLKATRLPSGRYRINREDADAAVSVIEKIEEDAPTLRTVSEKLDSLIEEDAPTLRTVNEKLDALIERNAS